MARQNNNYTQNALDYDPVTIASSGTVSSVLDCNGMTLVGLRTPAALTGTAITFQVSHDGTTYLPLKNPAGASVSIVVAVDSHIGLERSDFEGCRYIKFVSGSAEGAARILIPILARFN